LILSSAIGSGHMQASAAMVRGVELSDPDQSCSIVDFSHEVSAMARYGAAIVVEMAEETLGETLRILTSGDHRNRMVECAKAAHRPYSARSAAELILGGLT
jgi:hypothetical protein